MALSAQGEREELVNRRWGRETDFGHLRLGGAENE